MKIYQLGWGMLILLTLFSCAKEGNNTISSSRDKAFGPISKVYVVSDQDLWESPLRDTFKYYFQSAYPVLPQVEPMYDLKHFTGEALMLRKERRTLRAYVLLADLSNPQSPVTKILAKDMGKEKIEQTIRDKSYAINVGRNKWVDDQIIVYIGGYGADMIEKAIAENFNVINKKIRDLEDKKIGSIVYMGGVNAKLQSKLKSEYGIGLKIPAEYFLALEDKKTQTIWMRKETEKSSNNIMIRKLKYDSKERFSKEGIKAIRDSLGIYVHSDIPNSFMVTNDVDLPMIIENMPLNDNYAMEARGIWELENDYMGGPFVGYLVHNPMSNELIYVDGFIHAPGVNKRGLMLQLELILSSLSL